MPKNNNDNNYNYNYNNNNDNKHNNNNNNNNNYNINKIMIIKIISINNIISKNEFNHIVDKSPDFMTTFNIRI